MNKEKHVELLFQVTIQLEEAKADEKELTITLQNLEGNLQSIENRKKILQKELLI